MSESRLELRPELEASDKVQIIKKCTFDVVSLPAYKIGKGPSDSQATKQLTEPHFLPKSKYFFFASERTTNELAASTLVCKKDQGDHLDNHSVPIFLV